MLHLMRKHAGYIMIKLILGAIVVVFVFWGIGSFQERRAGRVALVNGKPISIAEYRETYNNLIQRLRATFGDTLDEKLLEQLKVKQQALNQLIDQKLLIQEAERLNLGVSTRELADAIRNIDAFHAGGAFDSRLYERVLNLNRMTPEAFEAVQKQSMLVNRLERFIGEGVKVSDLEIDAWMTWQNTQVAIRYVVFNPAAYRDIDVAQKDLEAFFKEKASDYRTEEKIKVRYVKFDPETDAGQVTLTEEDLKEYYDSQKDGFTTPKTVEARHILLKAASSDPPEVVDEKKKTLLTLRERVIQGEDFAALAKQYSEDTSKASGGLIGPFQKEMMVQPFGDAAFALKEGEISEPVRTQFGWHLIRVEKIHAEKTRSFEEVKPEIQKRLAGERVRTLAYDRAEAMYDALVAGMDFEKAAAEQKHPVVTTGFFSKTAPETSLADPAAFAELAFGLQAGELSDIKEMKGAFYLVQVVEKQPSKTPELATVSDRVRKDLILQKQWEKAQSDAESLLAVAKSGKSFEEAAAEKGVKVISSGFFKRNEPIPGVESAPEVSRVAFGLTLENRIAPNPIRGEKGVFAVALSDRKSGVPAETSAERENVKALLERQKQMRAFGALVSQLKEKADIRLEEGFTDT